MYENICTLCNPGAEDRKTKITPPSDAPSIYVGELAKSIYERAGEHWRGYREKREDSHILKHWVNHHQSQGQPQFNISV